MYELAQITQYRDEKDGTILRIFVPGIRLGDMLRRKCIKNTEIRFDDGRHISAEQRKKAYATIRDIADWMGDIPEYTKEYMKSEHIIRTGDAYFSLSNCSMDTAREFINTLMEFAIENGVPLTECGVERTDDIGSYLYYCLKHKKCAICGTDGEIHHEDAIGMGNDRRKVDDFGHRKICLCRKHHTIAHQMGVIRFRQMYKIYGITVNE